MSCFYTIDKLFCKHLQHSFVLASVCLNVCAISPSLSILVKCTVQVQTNSFVSKIFFQYDTHKKTELASENAYRDM